MKKFRKVITAAAMLLMMLVLAVGMSACGGREEAEADQAELEVVEENAPEVVDTIFGVDENRGTAEALEIDSVTLFDDGSVVIVPTDDLKKNEIKKEGVEGIYPFADSGKVKKIYLVNFGSEGRRTIVCLMEDGSLSALSANSLINDHIAVVMDNVSGRDNFVSVKQTEEEGSYGVIGTTEDGEEVQIDFSLNF